MLKELKRIAKEYEYKWYSRMKKEEILDLLGSPPPVPQNVNERRRLHYAQNRERINKRRKEPYAQKHPPRQTVKDLRTIAKILRDRRGKLLSSIVF